MNNTKNKELQCEIIRDSNSTKFFGNQPKIGNMPETAINITDKKMNEQMLYSLASNNYDFVMLINAKEKTSRVMSNASKYKGLLPICKIDYENELEKYYRAFCTDSDIDSIINKTKIQNIINELDKNNIFDVFASVKEDNIVCRKKFRYTYIDKEFKFISYTREDITGIFEEEQRNNHEIAMALLEAKRANRTKSDFLSRMSHEIRTPMNAIIGLCELAAEESDDPIALDYLNKINSSSEFLLGLINDILDMSKIESDKVILHYETVEVKSYLNQLLALVNPQIIQKNIEFNFECVNLKAEYLKIDRLRMEQILINLLSNAIKFTSNGGKIDFIIKNKAIKNGYTIDEIIVRDNGIGISKDFLPRLFEPFEQEYNEETSHFNGTGLGLSIAKNLVELMGGTIKVKSEKYVGTEFTIKIAFEIVQKIKNENGVQTNLNVDKVLLAKKRVLVVEDHSINAEIIKRLLQKKGMLIEAAANGQEAVNIFKKRPAWYFDIILMDIRMPVMDGLTASKLIRETDKEDAKKVSIIAMTANVLDEDVKKSKCFGMNDHITKPINSDKLFLTIKQQLLKKYE